MGVFDKKGEVEQAFLKVLFYGGTGSGKTFTALSVATSLGRSAVVDTERGTEPYRGQFLDPEGEPFLVARTRNATRIVEEVIPEAVKEGVRCLVVDEISTIWDDLKDQYIFREYQKQSKAWFSIEKNGKLPFQAWSFIKSPYRKMIRELLNAPLHVFLVARGVDEFEIGKDGNPVKIGEKVEAEKSTQFAPAVLVKMEWARKKKQWLALVEKDRWQCLTGQVFTNPDGTMFDPILAKLGKVHGSVPEPEFEEVPLAKGEEGPTSGQVKLLLLLGRKAGLEEEKVERALKGVGRVRAAALINEMTVGKYDGLLVNREKGEEDDS